MIGAIHAALLSLSPLTKAKEQLAIAVAIHRRQG